MTTADEVKALLGLEPNPSCGFTTPTYNSPLRGSWALLATTVMPGLVPEEDVELGDLDKLAAGYADFAKQILNYR